MDEIKQLENKLKEMKRLEEEKKENAKMEKINNNDIDYNLEILKDLYWNRFDYTLRIHEIPNDCYIRNFEYINNQMKDDSYPISKTNGEYSVFNKDTQLLYMLRKIIIILSKMNKDLKVLKETMI